MATNGKAKKTAAKARLNPGDEAIARQLLARVSALVPTLRERAPQTETLRRAPEENIRDLDDAGVFRAAIPVEYGGYALTPPQLLRIIAEISRGCQSTGWVVWVTATAQQWVGLFGEKTQDELFNLDWTGPLVSSVGNLRGPGQARRVDGGYMLKGRWPFNSACHYSAVHHLGAICMDAMWRGPILLEIPHEQVKILDDWHVLGMRGSGSNTVVIEEEIFVPEYRVRPMIDLILGANVERQLEGTLFKVNLAMHTAAMQAGIAVGMARSAVEHFQEQMGSRPIASLPYAKQSDSPVIQNLLGELHCKLRSLELLAANSAELVERHGTTSASPLEMAKPRLETAYVSTLAAEIVQSVFRAVGPMAIRESSIFQRLLRDSQVLTVHTHNLFDPAKEDFGRFLVEELRQTKHEADIKASREGRKISNVLVLTSSAGGDSSVSDKLAAEAVATIRSKVGDVNVVTRDLGKEPLPQLTPANVSAIRGFAQTEVEKACLAVSDELLEELRAADIVVIGSPMYNFSISTSLRTWFDYVLRAGETFSYTPEGPVGLLTGKQAIVIEARGGMYSMGPFQPFDYQEPYLRHLLRVIGITDVTFVHAEMLAFGPEATEHAITTALAKIQVAVEPVELEQMELMSL